MMRLLKAIIAAFLIGSPVFAQNSDSQTLPEFWRIKDESDPAYSDFSFKIAMQTWDDSLEHIWVSDVSRDGGEFKGFLSNDPVKVSGFKYGDEVTFTEADISDWQYIKDDQMYGHYTTRVLVSRLPAEQAVSYLILFGENP